MTSRRWVRLGLVFAVIAPLVVITQQFVGINRLGTPSPQGETSNGQQCSPEVIVYRGAARPVATTCPPTG